MVSTKSTQLLIIVAMVSLVTACAGGPSAEQMAKARQKAEMPTYYLAPAAIMFIASDANNDAKVTMEELETYLLPVFAKADRDENGTLKPTEYAIWAREYLGRQDTVPSFIGIDANQNDVVTQAEYLATFSKLFAQYDVDEDGILSRAEIVKYLPRPKMQQQQRRSMPAGMGREMPPGGGRRPTA